MLIRVLLLILLLLVLVLLLILLLIFVLLLVLILTHFLVYPFSFMSFAVRLSPYIVILSRHRRFYSYMSVITL